jgi:hypothetical protein
MTNALKIQGQLYFLDILMVSNDILHFSRLIYVADL